MFKIETYRNAKSFYENMTTQDGNFHLLPNSSLKHVLSRNVAPNTVMMFEQLRGTLFKEWNLPHTDLYFRSKIRDAIEKFAPPHLKQKFHVSIHELLVTFRYLMEFIGVKLTDRFPLSEEQMTLQIIMNDMYFDEEVRKYYKDRATLTKEEVAKRFGVPSIDRLYVYQMDYIDMQRMMLFYLFDQLGIEVIFRIPFEANYRKLYEGWEKVYEALGNSSFSSWDEVYPLQVDHRGQRLAAYLEGQDWEQGEVNGIRFEQFDHPISFKHYLKEHPIRKNEGKIFAVHDEDINIHLGGDHGGHLYSLPQGRFIALIAHCKKVEKNIHLSYETYVELMTSGWVQSGGVQGERALSLLADLHDYMDGVKTLLDIKERLQALIELQDVSREFDITAKEQTNQNRVKQFLTNPFRTFPYVHHHKYQITPKQLFECTRDLERKLDKLLLFPKEKRNVNTYVKELTTIFEAVHIEWDETVVTWFKKGLSVQVDDEWEFGQEELHLFLTLHLTRPKGEGAVKSFSSSTGYCLVGKDIHVTDLSLHSFPEHKPTLPYLLTHSWLKKSVQQSFVSTNKEIRIHALLVDYYSREYAQNLSVYSLYHTLANMDGTITFSWIKNLQDNDAPSVYFQLLKKLYLSTDEGNDEAELEQEYDWPEYEEEESLDVSNLRGIPDVYWLNLDFCVRKFFFTSILEHQPIYENDLHQQLSFGIIGSLLSEQAEGRKDLEELLFPLFPQWTNALKNNLIDTEFSKGLRDYRSYENIYYPKAVGRLVRLRSQYLPTKRWKIKNQFNDNRFREEDALKELRSHLSVYDIKAEKGPHCKMCPHLMICSKGEFSVDVTNVE